MTDKNLKINKSILNFGLSFCILPAPYRKVLTFLVLGIFAFCIFTANAANAATLYFSPSSGNFSVGNILTTSVLVNTQGQAVNNADAVINFPAGLLDVVSVNKSGSIFSLWVEEPAFSNSAGTISFNGGLPTPGFNGSAGKIFSVVFRVKRAGSASLIFSSAAVRANDGYGTDILGVRSQAYFNLVEEVIEKKPVPPPPSIGVPARPKITSTTHPDSDSWYSENTARFSWDVPEGVTAVRLLVDKNPNSVPSITYSPAIDSKELAGLEDAVWYFHARFKNAFGWGAIAHFRFQIDSVPPKPFSIEFADGVETDNPRPTILFETTDDLSGIDHYKIKIGEGDVFEYRTTGNPFVLPLQAPGKRVLVVKAYDKAGNFSEDAESFVIKPIAAPVITDYSPEVIKGESGFIKGETFSDAKVTAWFEKKSKFRFEKPFRREARADKDGQFLLIIDKEFEVGDYDVWVEVVDVRGAISEPTDKFFIQVRMPALLRIGDTLMTWLIVIIPLIALVLLLVFVIYYGWHKLRVFKKTLEKDLRKVDTTLHKAFDSLCESMRESIKHIEEAKSKRALTREEEKVIRTLKKNLRKVEGTISKEIKDIEKEIEKL